MTEIDEPPPLSVLQRRLVSLFVELCSNPDDTAVAAEADHVLHELDELLPVETSIREAT
jgi:hypothetical protein